MGGWSVNLKARAFQLMLKQEISKIYRVALMEETFGKQELVVCSTKMWSDEGQTRDFQHGNGDETATQHIWEEVFYNSELFLDLLRTLDIQNPAIGESLKIQPLKTNKPNQISIVGSNCSFCGGLSFTSVTILGHRGWGWSSYMTHGNH